MNSYKSCTKHDVIRLELMELLPPHCHADSCDEDTCNWKNDGDNRVDRAMVFGRECGYGLNSASHDRATK